RVLPPEHSGNSSSNQVDVQASTQVQLSDLESAANLKGGNLHEVRRTRGAIPNIGLKNALELKKGLQLRKTEPGTAKSEPHRQSFVYSVIHDHLLGGCRGKLTIDEKSVSFEPEKNSKDGFTIKTMEIGNIEVGDSLKIKVGDRT